MLKMFTTQLTGLFKRVFDKEQFQMEDGARLLAQAPVGDGYIYIKGFREMESVSYEALHGAEPLKHAMRLEADTSLSPADRVVIFTRFSTDDEAVKLGETLVEKGVPFVVVSGEKSDEVSRLAELSDVHINTHLLRPLLPTEDGSRIGFPSSMTALYIYFALKFTLEEILEEYE
ncbi:DUF2529 domain-containing protein [Lederbergia lenta]|uniref:Protein of uncharacterized function (DUF2529) n=1 Tax=Lederbergia lenta TaxID=1467 RepID=A0A2X4WEA0_LEDLE|nr:DUF2529 domain-containing protein [Lederbergia lenta]MCM3112077.1 DUF2529 domain-containing protein [Lederbergia lenta]MEC2323247.1 DUF2529 domain-containing protein [Lederbergia lenta]SQI63067.1 Protein of uncharacterised function (DUF2529) [Lederbergia lenta]